MSSLSATSAGLGIDLCPTTSTSIHGADAPIEHHAKHMDPKGSAISDSASTNNMSTLRSASSMRGLLRAEIGDSMVTLDIREQGSGFLKGQRIAADSVSPCLGQETSSSSLPNDTRRMSDRQSAVLSRHGTLLSVGGTPGRNTAELKSLLGNVNSRLKPGAVLLPTPGQSSRESEEMTSLEQAKLRARVEVDIILESNVCVQEGYLKGHVKVRVRKRAKNESTVMISGGKIRIIGFECIQNENERHTFYQFSAPLSEVARSVHGMYESPEDDEGFAQAKEGIHIIPFAMILPLEGGIGNPKGVMRTHSGLSLRYIAMFSIKVKERETGKRSIAHFYRDCEMWPRINPSVVLAPEPEPLHATTSKSLFMGGSGKVTLIAMMHRLHWIAGQQCFVKVTAVNNTKKTIRSLTLTLLRSTVIFKPHPHLDLDSATELDPDACQTTTTQKPIAQATLDMGQRGARGHASAKGWWTGVLPGETLDFSHFILLPPDALTVSRARLLEVQYRLRVLVSAGPLASDVQVELPIRIINFLSVDPPPSYGPSQQPEQNSRAPTLIRHLDDQQRAGLGRIDTRPTNSTQRVLESLPESDDESQSRGMSAAGEDGYSYQEGYSDNEFKDENVQSDVACSGEDSIYPDRQLMHHRNEQFMNNVDRDETAALGNLSINEDTDEVVQHAISSATIDTKYGQFGTRFADLYYSSVQEGLDRSGLDTQDVGEDAGACSPTPRPEMDTSINKPAHPKGPTSFALRVQEKMQAASDSGALANQIDVPPPVPDKDEVTTGGGISEDDPSPPSTRDSYFRSRNDMPDEVEPDHEHRPSAILLSYTDSSSSSKSSGAYSKLSLESCGGSEKSRTSEETSASTSAASSVVGGGSRLLPKPPLTNLSGLPVENDFCPPEVVAALGSARADLIEQPSGRIRAHSAASQRPPTPSPTRRARALSTATTQKLTAPSGPRPPPIPLCGGGSESSAEGSAMSVRDKIRDLEERVRAMSS